MFSFKKTYSYLKQPLDSSSLQAYYYEMNYMGSQVMIMIDDDD